MCVQSTEPCLTGSAANRADPAERRSATTAASAAIRQGRGAWLQARTAKPVQPHIAGQNPGPLPNLAHIAFSKGIIVWKLYKLIHREHEGRACMPEMVFSVHRAASRIRSSHGVWVDLGRVRRLTCSACVVCATRSDDCTRSCAITAEAEVASDQRLRSAAQSRV